MWHSAGRVLPTPRPPAAGTHPSMPASAPSNITSPFESVTRRAGIVPLVLSVGRPCLIPLKGLLVHVVAQLTTKALAGGLCADLTCGLRFENKTCSEGPVVGSWVYGEDGLYRLVACPDGTSLVNTSVGGSKGLFFHDAQRCMPCDPVSSYIIDPNSGACQQCPPGLVCSGGIEVEPRIPSHWKVEGEHYFLLNCSTGYFVFRGDYEFDPQLQQCLPCPPGHECIDQECTDCSVCAPGTYKPHESTGPCLRCPKGSYGPSAGATDLSACIPCPAGSDTNGTGNVHVSQCLCDLRLYRKEDVNGQPSCVACPKVHAHALAPLPFGAHLAKARLCLSIRL
jgi:hypothetical protein